MARDPTPAAEPTVIVRPVRRELADAAGVAAVLNAVIAEGRYTALTGHWTAQTELAFLRTLGPQSELFVADVDGCIAGFQVVEPFVPYASSMDHVAHFGTYVLPAYRGRGIGRLLADATIAFLRRHGYEKVVIYVLTHNDGGLGYYRSLGFEARGTLRRQTRIDGVYYDELFMEMHLEERGQ